MTRTSVFLALAAVSLILGLAHIAYYHPKLPETVAIHFNGQGEADGFGSRSFHSLMMAGLQIGMTGMFFGLGFLIKVLPTSLINVPNREYWLAPERKAESIAKIRESLMVIGIATQWFLVAINHITTLFNLGKPAMVWFWPVFGLYMAFMIGFCIWLATRFSVPFNPNRTASES